MRPRLIHPIWITIAPISKSTTTYDAEAREPIREAAKATAIKVKAQNRVRRLAEPEFQPIGVVEDVRGWLTVEKQHTDSFNYIPKRGDLISKIGHRTTQVYIVWWEDMAHYTDQDGAGLMRLYYSDRRPSARSPTMG